MHRLKMRVDQKSSPNFSQSAFALLFSRENQKFMKSRTRSLDLTSFSKHAYHLVYILREMREKGSINQAPESHPETGK